MRRRDFLKHLPFAAALLASPPLFADRVPMRAGQARNGKAIPQLVTYEEVLAEKSVDADCSPPDDLIEFGKKAANSLLDKGYSYIAVTDPNHKLSGPREVAAGAMLAVTERFPGKEKSFFGLEQDSEILSCYNATGEIKKEYLKNKVGSGDYSYPAYLQSMYALLDAISPKKTTLICMDEGSRKIDPRLMQQEETLRDRPDSPEYVAASQALTAVLTERINETCTTWAKAIANQKGNAETGVILGGSGHFREVFEGKTVEKLQDCLATEGVSPLGMVNLTVRQGFISPPVMDLSKTEKGEISIKIPDSIAQEMVRRNKPFIENFSKQSHAFLSAYQQLFEFHKQVDKTLGPTILRLVPFADGKKQSWNETADPQTIREIIKALEDSPFKEHCAIVTAIQCLEKSLSLPFQAPSRER